MLNKASGIVLQTTKYSETSLIVKVYTRESGLRSYIISGVRSKRSGNKAGLFQPLALIDFVVSGNESSKLSRITEISINQPYTNLPYNIIKSSLGMFINELLLHSFKEPHLDEDLYEFIRNSLLILDLSPDNTPNFHLGFMIQLSRFLGFYPQGEHSADTSVFDLQEGKFVNFIPKHPYYLSSAAALQLSQLLDADYTGLQEINLGRAERKQLLNAMILFYQLHISSFGTMRSAAVLEEIIA